MFIPKKYIAFGVLSLFLSPCVFAEVTISEIMYDLSGSDTGREWVEIVNSGSDSITVATSTWKFFENNTNHSLTLYQGNATISSGGVAVIVDNPQKFLTDWPQFTGTVFDSVFSLGNTSEIIAIKSSSTTTLDQVSYSSGQGGAGDGNSLQKVNGVWQALTPTPGASGSSSSSSNTNSSSSSSGTTSTTTSSDASSSSSEQSTYSTWPVEPQMFSRIIAPTTAIAGADIVLKGEAVGLEKKPVENARFLWNFGDGTTKEGESVSHAYNVPADYVVILDASSGKFTGTSRLTIHVISADISLGGIVSGSDGQVVISNNSDRELDLSWWRISNNGQFFTLPKNTKILSRGKLPLTSSVLGFPVSSDSLALLYPNGVVAYRFTNNTDTTKLATADQEKVPATTEATLPPLPDKKEVSEISKMPVKEAQTLSQTATVAVSAPTSSTTFGVVSGEGRKMSLFWLYGLGGVIILGLGFIFTPKKLEETKSQADEFTIIE